MYAVNAPRFFFVGGTLLVLIASRALRRDVRGCQVVVHTGPVFYAIGVAGVDRPLVSALVVPPSAPGFSPSCPLVSCFRGSEQSAMLDAAGLLPACSQSPRQQRARESLPWRAAFFFFFGRLPGNKTVTFRTHRSVFPSRMVPNLLVCRIALMYGSQTGNAQSIAEGIHDGCKERGLISTLLACDGWKKARQHTIRSLRG